MGGTILTTGSCRKLSFASMVIKTAKSMKKTMSIGLTSSQEVEDSMRSTFLQTPN
jgi:hypothetical protein